jgi:hypothetical protein
MWPIKLGRLQWREHVVRMYGEMTEKSYWRANEGEEGKKRVDSC